MTPERTAHGGAAVPAPPAGPIARALLGEPVPDGDLRRALTALAAGDPAAYAGLWQFLRSGPDGRAELVELLDEYVALGDAAAGTMPEVHAWVSGSPDLAAFVADLRAVSAGWAALARPRTPPPRPEVGGLLALFRGGWRVAAGGAAAAVEAVPDAVYQIGEWVCKVLPAVSLSQAPAHGAAAQLTAALPPGRIGVAVVPGAKDGGEVWRVRISREEPGPAAVLIAGLGDRDGSTEGMIPVEAGRAIEFSIPPAVAGRPWVHLKWRDDRGWHTGRYELPVVRGAEGGRP